MTGASKVSKDPEKRKRPGNGGKRANAGRPKFSINRLSAEAVEKAKESGEMPVEYMLRVMRDMAEPHTRRDGMAIAAAPYLHPKIAAVELTGNVRQTHEQALDALDD